MATFTAMTWNVENLFRPQRGSAGDERERHREKLGLLAGVVGRIDPDAVALQEVGGEEELADLQEALGGAHPHRTASAFLDGRGIRVAFPSKHPVQERVDIVEFPDGPALDVRDLSADGGAEPIDRMGRGALRVRVNKGGLTMDPIACHLKSKLLSFRRPGGGRASCPATRGSRRRRRGSRL
jgi:hypothetical protein